MMILQTVSLRSLLVPSEMYDGAQQFWAVTLAIPFPYWSVAEPASLPLSLSMKMQRL